MFELFTHLNRAYTEVKSTLAEQLGEAKIAAFEHELHQRSINAQPVMMVYGVYNAGKSSLINALAGETVAPIGDVPTTAQIHHYQIGDVQIIDAPGIDAPIEHERISREQLAKSDAVIFVISSAGMVDAMQTYNELERIVSTGKNLLICINNRENFGICDANFLAIKNHFYQRLAEHFANRPEVLTKISQSPVYLVNASLALKGKQDNNQKLITHSGINTLEKSVSELFKQTDSATIANTLAQQLNQLIEQAILQIKQSDNQGELDDLNAYVTRLGQVRVQLKDQATLRVNQSKQSLQQNLIAQTELQQTDQCQFLIESWIETQQTHFHQRLKACVKQLELEDQLLDDKYCHGPFFSALASQNAHNTSGQSSLVEETIKHAINQSKQALTNEKLIEKGLLVTMKQGKKWLPKLFKGIGPKTMEKMAGKALPYVGPTVMAISYLYDWNKQQKAIEEQRQQQQNQHLALRATVASEVETLITQWLATVDDILSDTFDPAIAKMQQGLQNITQQDQQHTQRLQQLRQVQQTLTLAGLLTEIG